MQKANLLLSKRLVWFVVLVFVSGIMLAACQSGTNIPLTGEVDESQPTTRSSPSPTPKITDQRPENPTDLPPSPTPSPDARKATNTLSPTLTQPWPQTPGRETQVATSSPTRTPTASLTATASPPATVIGPPPGPETSTMTPAVSPSPSPTPTATGQIGLLWFNPASVTIPSGGLSQVSLQLDQIQGVYGAQLTISFDAQVLSVMDSHGAQTGVQILEGNCPAPGNIILNNVNNFAGRIDYVITQISPQQACDGGEVAKITFECLATGSTSLVTILDSLVSDQDGNLLQYSVQPLSVECQ